MKSTDKTYHEVFQLLKKRFEEDTKFQTEMEDLTYFYGKKIIVLAKNEEQERLIHENFPDLVKSQFFQGYYVMNSMLSDNETEFPKEVWKLNQGIVRNELPILFNKIFKEHTEDWHLTEIGQKLGMKLVQEFDGVYDLVKQIRKDIALYGAYKAFSEDERYSTQKHTDELILGDPFDLIFLNPQVYMQAQFVTTGQEIWDLYTWSSFKHGSSWIGTIQFLTIPNNEQEFYLLQFTISETILEHEKYEMLKILLDKLPQEIRAVLQIRIHHTRELEIVTSES